jgi:hypothetical protein
LPYLSGRRLSEEADHERAGRSRGGDQQYEQNNEATS